MILMQFKCYNAEQLIGITMQEAGVSRIVPVDIEAAMDMVKV